MSVRLGLIWLLCWWLCACHSARLPQFSPVAPSYRILLDARPAEHSNTQARITPKHLPSQRKEVANKHRSLRIQSSALVDTTKRATSKKRVSATKPVACDTFLVAGSDTIWARSLDKPQSVALKDDPETTFVNALGVILAVAGIAMVFVGLTAETPKTEWGGLRNAMLAMQGLVIMALGVPLLFFQGKNGRVRRLREAREGRERKEEPVDLSPPLTPLQRSRRSKAALFIIGIVGACAIYLLFPSGLALILLSVVLACLITGLVLLMLK